MTDGDKRQIEGVVLVYATFPAGDAVEAVAATLVEARLAACVNIVPGMTSIYRWEGRINRDAEVVAVIKTTRALADRVVTEVRRRHPYTNPALMILPVEGGSADFLGWIRAEVSASPDEHCD